MPSNQIGRKTLPPTPRPTDILRCVVEPAITADHKDVVVAGRASGPFLFEVRMPEPLVVSIPHSLGKAEALRRLKPGFARATADVPLLKFDEQTWTGNRMTFRAHALGQVISGTADVGENDVRLAIVLPWILQKFAAAVQTAFKQRAQLLLEKKS
jgi:Putative polyhydroxyalkanoic acid system protein (PHA_gran_rgn)